MKKLYEKWAKEQFSKCFENAVEFDIIRGSESIGKPTSITLRHKESPHGAGQFWFENWRDMYNFFCGYETAKADHKTQKFENGKGVTA